jgi:hypothetical protein
MEPNLGGPKVNIGNNLLAQQRHQYNTIQRNEKHSEILKTADTKDFHVSRQSVSSVDNTLDS